jgi:hypothetical protein
VQQKLKPKLRKLKNAIRPNVKKWVVIQLNVLKENAILQPARYIWLTLHPQKLLHLQHVVLPWQKSKPDR